MRKSLGKSHLFLIFWSFKFLASSSIVCRALSSSADAALFMKSFQRIVELVGWFPSVQPACHHSTEDDDLNLRASSWVIDGRPQVKF